MGIPQKDNITPFLVHSDGNDDNSADMSLYVKQKHRDALLRILYAKKNISHADLAKQLDISASGLHAVFKKINDVDEPLVKPTKVGKYKYYNLTIAGRRFVEGVLMPPEQRLGLEHMREVWDIFQSQAGPRWEERFNSLFYLAGKPAEEMDDEIESAFCEFINSFLTFYKENSKAAAAFIEELISSAAIRQSILTYVESKFGTSESFTVLNGILSQDDAKAYGLLDELFELSIKKNELLSPEKYDVADTNAFIGAIQEIKSAVLHAIVADEEKDILRAEWIKQGMERQLAFYAAEKYRILVLEIGNRYKEG